jgi:hypothetical protein
VEGRADGLQSYFEMAQSHMKLSILLGKVSGSVVHCRRLARK